MVRDWWLAYSIPTCTAEKAIVRVGAETGELFPDSCSSVRGVRLSWQGSKEGLRSFSGAAFMLDKARTVLHCHWILLQQISRYGESSLFFCRALANIFCLAEKASETLAVCPSQVYFLVGWYQFVMESIYHRLSCACT
jgi:hypothetical protein